MDGGRTRRHETGVGPGAAGTEVGILGAVEPVD